jgi:succinate dehydrogenase/fumarate reductase flavoprotein subunit
MGWKELKAGLCKIMQDYCGEYKSERTLKMGLMWLNSIRESEAASVYARNPHELARAVECLTHITLGEMVFHSALARVTGDSFSGYRSIRLENGKVRHHERPSRWWLRTPYAPTYKENYRKHSSL